MPLTVYSCVSYSPAIGGFRTQDHWAALHFVHAIKGTALTGFAELRLPSGESIRINKEGSKDAPIWFAQLAMATAPWRELIPCGIVPIPDARCSLAANRPPHTHRLADALASELGPDAAAVDLLRWARPMHPSHLVEDSRDPQGLYGRLRLRDRWHPVRDHRVVLVDDVIASGAHLRAAAAFLGDCGATIVAAVCAAHACYTSPTNKSWVSPSVQVLSDFHADPGWQLPELYDGVEL